MSPPRPSDRRSGRNAANSRPDRPRSCERTSRPCLRTAAGPHDRGPGTPCGSPPPVKKKAAKKKAEKAPEKKAMAKKKAPAPELKTVPLVAGPAVVVASNVNVRGQAKLKSEVVTRITKGQSVTVLEEIVRNNSGPDEPSAWAKITLPPGAHAWINSSFIDAANHTVLPKKLNLRSGPGENYSVIGLLHRGDALKEVTTKGDWAEV